MCLLFILIAFDMLPSYQTIIPGSRLLDFPNPDFSRVVTLPDVHGRSFAELNHHFGSVPFHVRVYATSTDGNNANFVFEGTGACQNDGGSSKEPPSGVIFAYDKETIKVWTPRRRKPVISVGGVWGGGKHSQISRQAKITVEAWKSGPLPSLETKFEITTKTRKTFRIPHPLQQLPEMVSVRVTPTGKHPSGLHFHAIGASHTTSRMIGGVIFAYNITDVVIWLPNKPKSGCVAIGKNWGEGKVMIAKSCDVQIRLWVNAFPPPIFQSEWLTVSANPNSNSFVEIQHKLRLLPTYVRVQYRFKDVIHPLVFEAIGSVQTTQLGKTRFGGVLFAYDKMTVRIWLPSSNKNGNRLAHIIFVGDGWGDEKHVMYNDTAELRVQVLADKCMDKSRVVDAQGYCRDISEVELVQKMAPWTKCSNPCGNGTKTRGVEECRGRSLQPVIECNFEKDFCGLRRTGFNWTRSANVDSSYKALCEESADETERMGRTVQFLKEVISKEPHFAYTITQHCAHGKRLNTQYGRLSTRDLGGAEGCILTFKYTADSYFKEFYVESQSTGESEWKKRWAIEDIQVRRTVWLSAYVNIGYYVPALKRLRFVQKLPYSQTPINPRCKEKCHPVLLTNVTLKCEKDDLHVVQKDTCEEKKLPTSACIVNAFKPFSKGSAWSLAHNVKNRYNDDIGSFVTAVGSKPGDLIATYKFHIKIYNVYHIWFDSFAADNETNGITIEINDQSDLTYHADLTYNEKDSLWLPLRFPLTLQAGKHHIKLFQKEKFFKYRHLMIAPRNISVWSALGMQSHLIPDNNLMTLSGVSNLLGYSRLNGEGGWMPSDRSNGQFYLEIQLPELALLNKIATQGGRSLGRMYKCMTASYKLKFSLDRLAFAYYRKNIKESDEYEFTGNTDFNGINEHTFSYALVARAVRIYPENYTRTACLRVELYGFYMVRGMCPEILSRTREKNCTGNRVCHGSNMHCARDTITHLSKCDCNPSFHGQSCNMTGCDPNPCKEGKCLEIAGSFKCDCKPGFYGRYCRLKCPKGRYGRNCADLCMCPVGENCHPVNGTCSCSPGFEGLKCNKPCSNFTYGQDCLKKCLCKPPLQCDHVTGDCYCAEGYQGDKCDVKCSNGTYGRNCTKGCDCHNGGTCKADGKCACFDGWMADSRCQFPCPRGRFGPSCSQLCPRHGNSSCDRVTGAITCSQGYKGRFCHQRCPDGRYGEDCKHECQCVTANTRQCRKDSGECVCMPGWRGKSCNTKCENRWGEYCKEPCRCKHGGKCDHVTGKCTCLKGHNGTHCEHICAEGYYGQNCANRCDCDPKKTDKCDPASGTCSCISGHEGVKCESTCDEQHWGRNCLERCICLNDAICDNKDGFCYCGKGFHGIKCGKKCEQGRYGRSCAETCKCKNGAECDRMDGRCDCAAGYVGKLCEKTCDEFWYGIGCRSPCACVVSRTAKCNHINGSCSCKPGFKGKRCHEECDDGFYGHKCRNVCEPCRHSFHACDKINGTCACIDGFTGKHCMDDCDITKYGPRCSKQCFCHPELELCDNLDGTCYKRSEFTFTVNLFINLYTFEFYVHSQERLKENLALFLWNCLKGRDVNSHCMVGNASDYSNIPPGDGNAATIGDTLRKLRLINTFFVRIVDLKSKFSSNNEEVTVVTLTLLNNTKPVNGSIIERFLSYIPTDIVSSALDYEYYPGPTYSKKRTLDPINSKMRWIVIGVSAFGGLLTVFLVCLICRCTTRVPYPPPFQKVRRDSKDFEMEENMTCNAHLLAFENPYYDIIAAMGLDDDVEEDYYNPLYDNMLELHSDSETEPEDMYYSFRNKNYHRGAQYPYDKDSGFSSGTLM